jgi:hypothetical protein
MAEYHRLLSEQGGRCAICNEMETEARALSVDHDHRSNRIRGLLCIACNSVIGHAKDNLAILRAAIVYIERHKRSQSEDGTGHEL